MRIAIAGASGFLGTHLARRLTASGHEVLRLVRRPARGPDEISWDPAAGRLDPAALAGVTGAVNLAGAPIDGRRWNDRYKRVLLESRVQTTTTLAHALGAAGVRVLVNAGGINYYGDTGDRIVDEGAPSGEGFLAELCRSWEAATRPAEDAGVRVVRMRIGYPLHRTGGYLKPQVLLFRLGLGGPHAGGRHWMSWIALHDWLSAVEFVLARGDIAGAVNMVAPEPVRNADFARAFGAATHRPAVVPVPGFALRAVLGELSSDALSSVRAVPGVLTGAGFAYRYPDVRAALEAALHD